jgi:hypothetical protein
LLSTLSFESTSLLTCLLNSVSMSLLRMALAVLIVSDGLALDGLALLLPLALLSPGELSLEDLDVGLKSGEADRVCALDAEGDGEGDGDAEAETSPANRNKRVWNP